MKEAKPIILIVDDEPSMRASIKMLLQDDCQILEAADGKSALKQVKKENVDLVLLDIRLPEVDGLTVLSQIKEIDESIEVVMITAVKTVGVAVEAIKRGAYDFITKPFDVDKLESLIKKMIEKRRLERENLYLKTEAAREFQYEKIVGKSQLMLEIFKFIEEVAKSNVTVLICGESGTGKELVARAIHRRSERANHLFVPVSCAAIPETLLESELFGHEKGSFTGAFERHIGKFEIAHLGTLFLDEVGGIPLSMQSKLLRALQEREIERIGGTKPIPVDVRIIAATNLDLKHAVSEGKFREDLFYRLNVVPIYLPPLRSRKEDIPLLAEYFINKYDTEFRKSLKGISKEAMYYLINYAWHGNVRELENLIERFVVLSSKNEIIGPEKLPHEITKETKPALPEEYKELTFKEAIKKFESHFIKSVLTKVSGNKSKAAKLLGIHRNTLLQLEKKYFKNEKRT